MNCGEINTNSQLIAHMGKHTFRCPTRPRNWRFLHKRFLFGLYCIEHKYVKLALSFKTGAGHSKCAYHSFRTSGIDRTLDQPFAAFDVKLVVVSVQY